MGMGSIDVHVHPPTPEVLVQSFGKYGEQHKTYFRMDKLTVPIEEMLAEFDQAGAEKIVLLGWDAETATHLPETPNACIQKLVDAHPDSSSDLRGWTKSAERFLERESKMNA